MITRSYYASNVSGFLTTPSNHIKGQLAVRVGKEYAGDETQQIAAWDTQIEILKTALCSFGNLADNWGILLELPLLRLGRRIDTVLIIGEYVVSIEFKMGANRFLGGDIDQAVDYALCLRDFHGNSHGHEIVPILCAENGPVSYQNGDLVFTDDVSNCLRVNKDTLKDALKAIAAQMGDKQFDWAAYDQSSYHPTPDVVKAARQIYAGHDVKDIGRNDAAADALEIAANQLREITESAREKGEHVICFVTGEPGSGKTLLGLDLVFSGTAGRVAGEPAALLSGNRPLVFVLQEAITLDARDRLGIKAKEAQRQSQQALQTLLGYLKDHAPDSSTPPENVIVFDEAQRAWDATTGFKLMGREKSEPELFFEILNRLPWACLVCLVGPGQEINRGEGGLALWGEALANQNGNWKIYASNVVLNGANGISGLFDNVDTNSLEITSSSNLHLRTNLRAFRNDLHGKWVEALLAGKINEARAIADKMESPPALITRDLTKLKSWLLERRRGEHRVGLLASSGAVRLVAEGIPPSPRSNELKDVIHWFLKPTGDYRSSNALEAPLSEFVCQGLEIDYVGLCWGNDLIWENDEWVPRKMRAPNWSVSRNPEERQYSLNARRVLLASSRALGS